MDPNVNLAEQRRIIGRVLTDAALPGDLERLAELTEALDEWISNGGALPTAWERNSLPPRARARALYIDTACLVQAARVAASRDVPGRHQQAIRQLTDARSAAGAFFDEEIGK